MASKPERIIGRPVGADNAKAATRPRRAVEPAQMALFCQRWRDGRTSYRPAGEPFDPSRLAVEPIDEAVAKRYIQKNHYSGTYPAARFRGGVFLKEPFAKARLVGVGVFGVPMTQAVIPAYFEDLAPAEGVEFSRFTLDEDLPGNSESWVIGRLYRLLRTALPEVQGVLAYSDPVERRDERGELVKRGHIGTIYQATNAEFRGRSSPRTLWLAPSGACLSDRLLSKVRRCESGERYALERLAALGARRRCLGEEGAAYIASLKEEGWLRAVRHPGNLAYTWRLRPGSR
jgi:hypothetical protein